MKNAFSGIIALLFVQILIGQSAWTLEGNSWYTQVNYTRIGPYDELFIDGNESVTTPREIVDNTIQLYAEYGVNNRTTLYLSLPVKSIATGSSTTQSNPEIKATTVTSFGNIGLGFKQNLFNKDVIISVGLAVEANTANYDDASGIRTGYDAWTLTPAVFIGRGFNDFFLQGTISAGFRTNNYSHFFRGGAEVGYKFFDQLWAIIYLDYKASFYNGDIILPANNVSTSLYVNDQEYVGYGLKGIFELTQKLGITAGFGGAFSANAEARKAALNVGVFMKIDNKKE